MSISCTGVGNYVQILWSHVATLPTFLSIKIDPRRRDTLVYLLHTLLGVLQFLTQVPCLLQGSLSLSSAIPYLHIHPPN